MERRDFRLPGPHRRRHALEVWLPGWHGGLRRFRSTKGNMYRLRQKRRLALCRDTPTGEAAATIDSPVHFGQ
jgi:hypothetical protein